MTHPTKEQFDELVNEFNEEPLVRRVKNSMALQETLYDSLILAQVYKMVLLAETAEVRVLSLHHFMCDMFIFGTMWAAKQYEGKELEKILELKED